MKPWEGMPLEKEIDAYVKAVRKVASAKKEPWPPGWKLRGSTTAWGRIHGKGKGTTLSHEFSIFMGTRCSKLSTDTCSGGRVEAVAIGMMVWPDAMRVSIAMTPKERRATLAVIGEEPNEASHIMALGALYQRVMKRYARKCTEEEDS